MDNKVEYIAKACHEANRVWCQANGDNSQKHWEEAEQWQRDSAINGVKYKLDNPDAPASAQHDAWSKEKIEQGWVYGEVKDAEKKTHPCLVPFEHLPEFQQKKDKLFQAIVEALSPAPKVKTTAKAPDHGMGKSRPRHEITNEIESLSRAFENISRGMMGQSLPVYARKIGDQIERCLNDLYHDK